MTATTAWMPADPQQIDDKTTYLVKTNGAEDRDPDLKLMPGIMLRHLLKPNIIRGRPMAIAIVDDQDAIIRSAEAIGCTFKDRDGRWSWHSGMRSSIDQHGRTFHTRADAALHFMGSHEARTAATYHAASHLAVLKRNGA